jgi:hypothetical protein
VKGALAALFLAVLALPALAIGDDTRSAAARAAFVRTVPCPQDKPHAPNVCPGYVVDHVIPLCAGGPDLPGNMRWAGYRDAAYKDREEARLCALVRKGVIVKGSPPSKVCDQLPKDTFPRLHRDFKCRT